MLDTQRGLPGVGGPLHTLQKDPDRARRKRRTNDSRRRKGKKRGRTRVKENSRKRERERERETKNGGPEKESGCVIAPEKFGICICRYQSPTVSASRREERMKDG